MSLPKERRKRHASGVKMVLMRRMAMRFSISVQRLNHYPIRGLKRSTKRKTSFSRLMMKMKMTTLMICRSQRVIEDGVYSAILLEAKSSLKRT